MFFKITMLPGMLTAALAFAMFSPHNLGELRAEVPLNEPGPAVDVKEATSVKGKIEAMATDGLVISANDARHMFKVNKDTKVTINGTDAKWSALMPGMSVSIVYFRDGDKYVAKVIMAMRS